MNAFKPRLLRPVSDPFGNYLRVGRNDHTTMLAVIAEGKDSMVGGLVFNPVFDERHAGLFDAASQAGIETVLDPKSFELSTDDDAARASSAALPWAGDAPHRSQDFGEAKTSEMASLLSERISKRGFDATLAPSHFIEQTTSPWLSVDAALTRRLRKELDESGKRDVRIYYPLMVHSTLLRNPASRIALISALSVLPIDGLWLRVHPFGTSSSGPIALKQYIEACRDFQTLGIPIVAERTGTVGVGLLAFGAVGGIESGITFGEGFDAKSQMRPRQGVPFAPAPRVYVADLGAFVSRVDARTLFENRQMRSLLSCRVPDCCRRGSVDTEADPRRHFVLRRASELVTYGRPPEPLRASTYLEEFLRPATDYALRASKVLPSLVRNRKQLENWRLTLGALQKSGLPPSNALVPRGERLVPRQQMGA